MNTSLFKHILVSLVVLIISSGCTLIQNVTPVALEESRGAEIVIIPEVEGVRQGFKKAYREALEEKGFSVVEKPVGTGLSEYPLSSTYAGRWHWDLALYMIYAEIHIFKHGEEIGHAVYDARRYGGLAKFINAEEKVKELATQLFPEGVSMRTDSEGASPTSESDAD